MLNLCLGIKFSVGADGVFQLYRRKQKSVLLMRDNHSDIVHYIQTFHHKHWMGVYHFLKKTLEVTFMDLLCIIYPHNWTVPRYLVMWEKFQHLGLHAVSPTYDILLQNYQNMILKFRSVYELEEIYWRHTTLKNRYLVQRFILCPKDWPRMGYS